MIDLFFSFSSNHFLFYFFILFHTTFLEYFVYRQNFLYVLKVNNRHYLHVF